MLQHLFVRFLLLPLSLLYGFGVSIHRFLYLTEIIKPLKFSLPILSIGNLSVGGSGKTPHVEYLVHYLKNYVQVGVLSRGYNRKSRGFIWVEPYLKSDEAGDEPLQIKSKFPDVSVAVCESRVSGVSEMVAINPALQVILLDDAFQHRAIKPELDIILTTFQQPFFSDYLLPFGRLHFIHRFNTKGHELQGLYHFEKENGSDTENQIYYATDATWNAISSEPYKSRSGEYSDESDNRIKLDYIYPINEKDKLEAGYQGRWEKSDQDFVFEEYNYLTNNWDNNPKYSSIVDFTQNIQALYGTYSHSNEKFSYQLGLRTEYSNRNLYSQRGDKNYKLDLLDWFPTIHLSQKFKKDYELQGSYSRRLNRPGGYMLEPFPSIMDPYNIRIGNPNLTPEYTGSYEMTLLKRIKASFISLEAYYRHTTDLMSRIQTLGEDGIMYHTMDNLNDDYSLGSELMINYEFKPGIRLVASGTLYNYWLKGDVLGENVDQQSTNFDGKLNFDLKIAKNTRMQIMGIYRGPTVSAQGQRDGMFFSNASVKQEFWKNKMSATLQVQDIFGTMKFSGTSYGPNFENQFKFKRESQIVQLTLSYKINNFKNKPSKDGPDASGNEGGGMGEF